jgi:hypothetical protein
MRPTHIHLYVQTAGYELLRTQIYDSARQYVKSDTVFATLRSGTLCLDRHQPPHVCRNLHMLSQHFQARELLPVLGQNWLRLAFAGSEAPQRSSIMSFPKVRFSFWNTFLLCVWCHHNNVCLSRQDH